MNTTELINKLKASGFEGKELLGRASMSIERELNKYFGTQLKNQFFSEDQSNLIMIGSERDSYKLGFLLVNQGFPIEKVEVELRDFGKYRITAKNYFTNK